MKRISAFALLVMFMLSFAACKANDQFKCSKCGNAISLDENLGSEENPYCEECKIALQETMPDNSVPIINPTRNYELSNPDEPHDIYDIHYDGYFVIGQTPAAKGAPLLQYIDDPSNVTCILAEGQLVKARGSYSPTCYGYVSVSVAEGNIIGWVQAIYLYPVNPFKNSSFDGKNLNEDMVARVTFDTPDDAGVNFRQAPSSGAKLHMILHEGAIVEVMDSYRPSNNEYLQIRYAEPVSGEYLSGWVLARYLEFYGYKNNVVYSDEQVLVSQETDPPQETKTNNTKPIDSPIEPTELPAAVPPTENDTIEPADPSAATDDLTLYTQYGKIPAEGDNLFSLTLAAGEYVDLFFKDADGNNITVIWTVMDGDCTLDKDGQGVTVNSDVTCKLRTAYNGTIYTVIIY